MVVLDQPVVTVRSGMDDGVEVVCGRCGWKRSFNVGITVPVIVAVEEMHHRDGCRSWG
jgi:RNase P subunit RPR2